MNERETKAGRRNQTLFALGQVAKEAFRWSDIEAIVKSEFPDSTADKMLNISQILSGLASPDVGILRSTPKGDAYIFTDPSIRMCVRAMLRKTDRETVYALDIGST